MSKHRILLADDDPQTTSALALALADLGCEIITVTDGRQALAVIEQPPLPSLIVSDWQLPEFDGLKLFTTLKESADTRTIPFIFLTDCQDEEVRRAMLEIGVTDYWCKPFNQFEVAIRVKKIIDRARNLRDFSSGERQVVTDISMLNLNQCYENEVINHRYKLLEQIGDGGMGLVFRAQDITDHRIVALKLLRREFVNQKVEQLRFAREAEAAMRIDHANVVTTYEYGIVTSGDSGVAAIGQAFIIMELLIGHSLEDELSVHEPLPIARTLAIIHQVGLAIAEAHHQGVIHRDIKPSNIHLLDNHGAHPIVKVLDFGIAWVNSERDMERLTAPDIVMGTPHYLSPEQATGRPLDERSDIYGLGIVAYEMLTGRPPFDGNSLAVMLAHLNVPPKPIKQQVEVEDWLANLVMQMIEKDPAARPQSMNEIVNQLISNQQSAIS